MLNQEHNSKAKKTISGFSKLSKRGKIRWIVENFFKDPESVMRELMSYWHSNEDQQKILDGFSENTISNFYLPYGVAPNFVINGKTYCVPMVTEESSVVAAAASAAKFWMDKGGFNAEVLGMKKVGHVHFKWQGPNELLKDQFPRIRQGMIDDAGGITKNMERRGGGILDIELIDANDTLFNYYQIKTTFDTCDSMGANFINTVLESHAKTLNTFIGSDEAFQSYRELEVIMSIMSNYTPECLVRVMASCPVGAFGDEVRGLDAKVFAEKFCEAVNIARIDQYRATTHNKGIFNGIDSVVIATGNDFRAIEACGHSYAARDGHYRSLSQCKIENDVFTFWLDIPLAVGTVGGTTSVHPMARRSLELLEHPNAKTLMQIIAATGLAQNFAAVSSLITTGIQKGHMKMHLKNILVHLKASESEIEKTSNHFRDKVVSHSAVREYLADLRRENIYH